MLVSFFRHLFAFSTSYLLLHADNLPIYQDTKAPLETRVEALFQALTPDERIFLLSAHGFRTQAIPRLGIPEWTMVDATQGVRGGEASTQGKATLFGCGLLMAASWDTSLVHRIGHGVGIEALNKGTGAETVFGPGLNIIRTPLGGRSGEYMSEDPYLTSRMGVAYVEGMQETGCAACVKHYVCNNEEFERDSIDALVDERALREIYTPAFLAAVKEAHVWTVMCAYNRVNGTYCSANWYLLRQLLKNEAGFDGCLLTDWDAAHSTLAINDGCDLETPGGRELTPEKVKQALAVGELVQANVDEAVHRILRTIIRVGLMDGARRLDPTQLNTPESQKISEQVAEEGMVLLKNKDNILPLDPSKVRTLALIGATCKNWQMGTNGSGGVDPFQSVNAYDGIVERSGKDVKILYNPGDNISDAAKTAQLADVAIVFVDSGGESEGSDRASFALPGNQDDLIQAVVAANPRTIVVLNNGAPVQVSAWSDQVSGLIEAWFPGEMGGTALAKILFGDVNPSGKLVYTLGKKREDYPDFGHYPKNDALSKAAGHDVVDYAEGIYVGYRAFDKRNISPSFPFGYGLSYTNFRYDQIKASSSKLGPEEKVTVSAEITNTGSREGTEVVQLYMHADLPKIDRPIRELKGFARVELEPGETKPVSFTVSPRDLAYCDVPGKQWKAEAGNYSLELGSSSREICGKAEVCLTADYTEALPGLGANPPILHASR